MKKLDQKIIIILISIILIIIAFIILNKTNKNTSPTINQTEKTCKKAGCSNALCVESDQKNTASTCEWKDEYACYQKAKCERQSNGKCGFTQDEELKNCLEKLTKVIKKSPLK